MVDEFERVVAGMTGAQLIQVLNGNSDKTKIGFENVAAALLLRALTNNIKEFRVENGKLQFTLNGTDWYQADNNVWGSISGTISNQADLMSLLNAKASATDLTNTNNQVGALSTRVDNLGTTVSTNTAGIETNRRAIGEIQTKQASQVSSNTIVGLRIASNGLMQYTTDGVTWVNIQSLADINWGAIGGEISNQQDLQQILNSKINLSQLTAHTNNTNNPHSVTKAQVGLGDVDNTSDVDKPISNAQQVAFDALTQSVELLNDIKMNTSEDITAIEYISLERWNAAKEEGTLDNKTLYIVD